MKKLLIFAKSPIKGSVKTRLAFNSPLDAGDILRLYTAFLKDTIFAAVNSYVDNIFIAYYPESGSMKIKEMVIEAGFRTELECGRITIFPQNGMSFDARITMAVNKVMDHYDSLIIVGSDTPTLSPAIILDALNNLGTIDQGMVLGPSGEGGVYLIGIKIKDGLSFDGVFEYGNEIENLISIARSRKLPLYVLNELTDIDICSDLLTIVGILRALTYSSYFNKDLYLPKYTISTVEDMRFKIYRDCDSRYKKLLK